MVLIPIEEYERIRRLRAYFKMVAISRELAALGPTASELYESSRRELEGRAWS